MVESQTWLCVWPSQTDDRIVGSPAEAAQRSERTDQGIALVGMRERMTEELPDLAEVLADE
jgi:hypothetical protein